ncbi:hypothetical protein EDB80DRAFT_687285 [Ilyonectria destructans]|nr:hypothetical protein EDB80DRAFT_687285 [Ilyonectria destructans]
MPFKKYNTSFPMNTPTNLNPVVPGNRDSPGVKIIARKNRGLSFPQIAPNPSPFKSRVIVPAQIRNLREANSTRDTEGARGLPETTKTSGAEPEAVRGEPG